MRCFACASPVEETVHFTFSAGACSRLLAEESTTSSPDDGIREGRSHRSKTDGHRGCSISQPQTIAELGGGGEITREDGSPHRNRTRMLAEAIRIPEGKTPKRRLDGAGGYDMPVLYLVVNVRPRPSGASLRCLSFPPTEPTPPFPDTKPPPQR